MIRALKNKTRSWWRRLPDKLTALLEIIISMAAISAALSITSTLLLVALFPQVDQLLAITACNFFAGLTALLAWIGLEIWMRE